MTLYTVRPATPEDAPFLAQTVMGALGEELCIQLADGETNIPLVRKLFTVLAESDNSQYSYTHSWVAQTPDGISIGAVIAYDGACLLSLRKAFIREAGAILGWNVSEEEEKEWEPETGPQEIYIDSLFVAPAFRRNGIAARLIQTVEEHYRPAGKPVGLLVEPENLNARRTYERLGFQDAGRNGFLGVPMIHMQKR